MKICWKKSCCGDCELNEPTIPTQNSFNVQDESFHRKYAHVGQQREKQNTVKII